MADYIVLPGLGNFMKLTSDAFKHNGRLPSKYTCDGANISPPLRWEDVPTNAKSLVLIVEDPDAVSRVWTHWVVFNIPVTETSCWEGFPPKNSLQGLNDSRIVGYEGPCPPNGTHRYFFKLYALDDMLSLQRGCGKKQVEDAMKPHIIEKTELIGTYVREEWS